MVLTVVARLVEYSKILSIWIERSLLEQSDQVCTVCHSICIFRIQYLIEK